MQHKYYIALFIPHQTMKKQVYLCATHLLILFLLSSSIARAQECKPSGKLKGTKPPKDQCNTADGAECCVQGKLYDIYNCSPPVSKATEAILTLNNFEKNGDGGAPSECDQAYHSNKTSVVALSTGWFNDMKRCLKNITIYGNGMSVKAMVVDECDSTMGCDKDHAYQPPCDDNIVDASEAVWRALGVPVNDWGWMNVSWSDNV